MAEVHVEQKLLATFRGKVVVLAGGAQGIGAATVQSFFEAGAHVYFGDWDDAKGSKLAERLQSEHKESEGSVNFLRVNVRDYQSLLALFDTAFKEHGQVDSAICCAAVTERTGWWEPNKLDLESVKKTPTPVTDVIDINLNGTLYFARIALAYLREGHTADRSATAENLTSSKSLILIASVAGFKESPGLFAYSAAKHGVVGLMRALRQFTPSLYGIRVNTICPWATDTQLLEGVKTSWVEEKMPLNQPIDVARIIAQVAADEKCHGKAVYVAGGRGFDIEEGINRTEPQWLGEQQAKDLNRGQEILGLGMDWGEK